MAKRRKLVTIKDLAKKAGVSAATVSFALNNPERVGENTRRHVLRLARELEYSRVKKFKHRGQIGFIADDYYNLIFGEFYDWVTFGILEELKKRGLNVMVESTGKDPDCFPKMITKGLVDGIIFLGKISPDLVYVAKQKGISILMAGHPLPDTELCTVVSDGRSGAVQAVKHLLELGHKKIAIITGGPPYDPITNERVEGYRFALAEAGIAERKDFFAQADFGKPATANIAANRLLELSDPPSAIFCLSDSLAYRAYEAIKSKNLRIPEDISVMGFDDISAPAYACLPSPPLSTIHVDRKEMGKVCVEILLEAIQNPDKRIYRYALPVKLAIKKSTAPLAVK